MRIETRHPIRTFTFHSPTGLTALSPAGVLERYEDMKVAASHTIGKKGMGGRLSSDGSLAAIWHGETTLEFFTTTDARKLGESPQLNGGMRGLAFSPDGALVLYATTDAMLHCWSIRESKMLWKAKSGLGEAWGIRFSPDGRHAFVTSADANIRIHNTQNGELEAINEELPISMFDCVYTPDGQTVIAAGAARQIHVFKAQGLKLERRFRREADPVGSIALSRDGKYVAAALFQELSHRNPTYLVVYDFSTGDVLKEITTRTATMGLALSPTGRRVAWSMPPSGIEFSDF